MSLKYLVVDADGQLYQRSAPRWDVALRDVGPEGWDRVGFPGMAAKVGGPEYVVLAGFVNDIGLLAPERYPRNVVGTCLLAACGANVQPYAGDVVFTGWEPTPWGDDAEIRTLTERQIVALRQLHGDIRRVLGLDPGGPGAHLEERLCAWIREIADIARDAPTPVIRFITDPDEVEAALRRMR